MNGNGVGGRITAVEYVLTGTFFLERSGYRCQNDIDERAGALHSRGCYKLRVSFIRGRASGTRLSIEMLSRKQVGANVLYGRNAWPRLP